MPVLRVISTVPGLLALPDGGNVILKALSADVLRGATGPKGDTGATGPKGTAGANGVAGATGAQGPAGTAEIDLVSAEAITAFTVVTSDGYEADSNDVSTFGRVIGIAKAGVALGFSFAAVGSGGEITNPGWAWTRGDRLFLNGTAISTIAPSIGYSQFIGTASAADTIAVEIQPPILL